MGRKRSIISGVLVLTMSMTMALQVHATTIEDAQKKGEELEQQKSAAEAEKNALTAQLNEIITDMNETQTEMTKKESEIEKAENDLIAAKVDENQQYQSMKKRIQFMYENGDTKILEVMMESKTLGEFLNKAEYASKLSDYDREKLEDFQDVVEEVEKKEQTLQTEYDELSSLQTDLMTKQTEVQTLLDSNNLLLADLETQIGDNAADLEKLIAEAEEAKRIQQEQEAAQQQGGGGPSYTEPSGGNVVSGNGYFTHPCPGMSYQSSYFGEIREYEVGGHKGHDYAAAEGTPTYAAAAGTVLIAEFSLSAGNWVVIDHGNGLTTKYMHHSALCVTAGQYVEKGQQIGFVGSTGQSTGPHLHFQVEENGIAVNPDKYL
ncbi:peptidoglycan DD-metalloendopeptidase family protein [Faecalicatena acetigenes]|uniref:Peptidoglycan DD-metalloendopeptidase family protein n=1 Tax=Faecalicatena acetigenes TaxID=2981790 RepID=A0ABT2T986_9FIRM|nr:MULTISPECIES: M23 family metallopeptidase [Lachnospiraceae]MCU6746426.1 peptidoglycan DD-metalloendopeptidase family protein [Faecalicatena acetigenes]SCH17586.1 Glycyl-glycine endopeptidase lytM precursor [uncultured Clostridium sp.]